MSAETEIEAILRKIIGRALDNLHREVGLEPSVELTDKTIAHYMATAREEFPGPGDLQTALRDLQNPANQAELQRGIELQILEVLERMRESHPHGYH